MKALRVVAAVAIAAAFVFTIARASDHETRFATFTRDGITLECERITDITGRTFYDSCVRVPWTELD